MHRSINDIRDIFSKRLTSLRCSKGLNQEDVAHELGISRQHYANLENGNANPSFSLLYEIVCYFNCSADYLLGRTDNREGYPVISNDLHVMMKNTENLHFDDIEITEKEKEKIISIIKYGIQVAKDLNKSK